MSFLWVRGSGAAALVGGGLWSFMITLTAVRPEDPFRGAGVISLLAFALVGAGAVGTYLRLRSRAGRLGEVAVVLGVVSIALLGLARIAVDSGLAPALVFGAAFAVLFTSILLFGVSVTRAGVFPRGSGAQLLIGTALLPFFNFGDSRIWLALPFGAAWMWLGYVLVAEENVRVGSPAAAKSRSGSP